MSKIKVRVPDYGWVRENVAPQGSGRMEMGLSRVTAEVDGPGGELYEVYLVEDTQGIHIEGACEIDRETNEQRPVSASKFTL